MIKVKTNAMKYKDTDGIFQDSGILISGQGGGGDGTTDTTLTKSGIAADAKETGDRLEEISKDINDLREENFVKTINGVAPDENGNVVVSGGGTEVCPYEKVSSTEEMTDTSKKYLMNGYVYSYIATSGVEKGEFFSVEIDIVLVISLVA